MKESFLRVAQGGIVLTWVSALMLWLTKAEVLGSQSAFANQENVIWYIFIHLGMIVSFAILSAITPIKEFAYGLVMFASGLVLMLDMYGYSLGHNISTALIFILSSYSLIAYENKRIILYYTICGLLGTLFLSAFIKIIDVNIFLIESIIEFVFGVMVLVRIEEQIKLIKV